jgi:hypothetical protein
VPGKLTLKMSVQPLEIPLEQALFEGEIQGVIAPIYENERPMRGIAGLLDWRLSGAISMALKQGFLTGQIGECGYVPIQKADRVYHVVLVGCGTLARFAKRGLMPDDSFRALRKNLRGLGLEKLGASRSDLGGLTDDYLNQQLEGAPLWLAQ